MLTGTGMRRLLPFSPQKSLAESTFPYQNPTRFNTLDLSQQANDFFFFFLLLQTRLKYFKKQLFIYCHKSRDTLRKGCIISKRFHVNPQQPGALISRLGTSSPLYPNRQLQTLQP